MDRKLSIEQLRKEKFFVNLEKARMILIDSGISLHTENPDLLECFEISNSVINIAHDLNLLILKVDPTNEKALSVQPLFREFILKQQTKD